MFKVLVIQYIYGKRKQRPTTQQKETEEGRYKIIHIFMGRGDHKIKKEAKKPKKVSKK